MIALLGVIAGLGQAPLGWMPATVLALAVWFARTPLDPRQAAMLGWWFGLGYFGWSLRWIVEPFLVDVASHGWMAPFALVFMAAGGASFWAVAVWLSRRFTPHSLLAIGLWVAAAEMLRSHLLTGFPWALLGHVWIGWGPDQLAALGGPHALTLLTTMLAVSLLGLYNLRWIGAIVPLVVVLTALWSQSRPDASEAGPIVRLIQPNAPQDEKWDPEKSNLYYNRMLAMTASAPVPDLIVWPESAIPTLLDYSQSRFEVMSEAAQGAPLLLGVLRNEGLKYFNSAAVIGRAGAVEAIYDKQHLVPFGEYVPFGEWLGRIGIRSLAPSEGMGFTVGDHTDLVDIRGIGPARILICYEAIFAEEVSKDQRPRLLIVITNDAWFGNAAGPEQHFAQARLRAIEQGLPIVRTANTGISAVIDAYGGVMGYLPLGAQGHLDLNLPAPRSATTYSQFGDWPIASFLIIAICAIYARSRSFGFDAARRDD